jgi:polyisoprenoid-binding protein YceI
LCLAGASAAAAIPCVAARATFARSGTAEVSFTALGPAGMRIEGKNGDLKAADDGTTLKLTLDLSHFETGIGLRDRHMKDHLEVTRYPIAELSVARASLRTPAEGAPVTTDAPAMLTLHGKSKPVTVHYTAERAPNAQFQVRGSFRIDMTAFGMEAPRYLGVSVKPNVDIAATFALADRS